MVRVIRRHRRRLFEATVIERSLPAKLDVPLLTDGDGSAWQFRYRAFAGRSFGLNHQRRIANVLNYKLVFTKLVRVHLAKVVLGIGHDNLRYSLRRTGNFFKRTIQSWRLTRRRS